MANFPVWADHIVAFIFGLAIPLYSLYKRPKDLAGSHFESFQKKRIYLFNSLSLFMMALVILTVWLLFNRPFSELGFKQINIINSWLWLTILFIILYVVDTWVAINSKENPEKTFIDKKTKTPFMPTKRHELPLYFLMCFCAGVFEEIIFRGFLVTYMMYLLSDIVSGEMWAVFLPALVFSLAHYYQGSKAVLKILILSVLFGYIFILSDSLLIVMILHFLVDAIGGLLTMKYMKKEMEDPI
jgi:membrane protease YdiL (CAAX protease family)